jgi:hypothetical protein
LEFPIIIQNTSYILLLLCAQESADDLVKLYKRVSLDDDLDDQLRSQLLSQLSAGATSTLSTLRLVSNMLLLYYTTVLAVVKLLPKSGIDSVYLDPGVLRKDV